MRLGVLQQVNAAFQCCVFIWVAQFGPRNFVYLKSQKINFARPSPLIAAHRGQRGIDFGHLRSRCAQCRQINVGKGVEGGPLGWCSQQALVFMLAVQVDEFCPQFTEVVDRRQTAIDIGP